MLKDMLWPDNTWGSGMPATPALKRYGYLPQFLQASIGVLVVVMVWVSCVSARQGEPPRSAKLATLPLSEIAAVTLPGIDAKALRAADKPLGKPAPIRFAVPRAVNISPTNSGTWENLSDQGRLWRLQVSAPGAENLNFGFTTYRLPPGASLHILSVSDNTYEGPYTAQDNKAHGQLWTPVVAGGHAVIELYVPAGAAAPELVLTQIGVGYRDLLRRAPPSPEKQGSCNIDVVCPEGDMWRDQIRSVALYTIAGSAFCTGQMIMDVPGTFRPFFLTAAHCDISRSTAPSIVVFWNFESSTCGALDGGRLDNSQTGATFLAADPEVDVALVELDSRPEPAFQVFYSGWDRSGATPPGSVAIHHPRGEEKAISFNDDALTIGDSCIGPAVTGNTHWFVDNWEEGTTEPGSSGSGLWHPENQKLIGTLSGGLAACGLLEFDCYGMFAVAWDHGVSASERLRDWLDPNNEAPLMVEGADPGSVPGLPLEVPDNDAVGVSHGQNVTQNVTIADVNVRVQVEHTRVGDLQIILQSPSGTEVVLLDRPGVPLTSTGCEDNDLDVTFDDDVEIDLETYCAGMVPWYQGTANPLEALEAFRGESAGGAWTLTVVDHAALEQGQLVDWQLMILGRLGAPLERRGTATP